MCFGVVGLAVIVAVLFLFRPGPTTSTTPRPTLPPTTVAPTRVGECTLWGDPHVLTFDGFRPSFYGEGTFWIVKSNRIKIQGRFMGTVFTHGLSATNKIAVGGIIVDNHVIEVGTMDDGPPTVDGVPVLTLLGSTHTIGTNVGTMTYNSEGEL